jgi:diguanylate cyclase (GGDEF)-like protein/PAS domain S-box-containing protein
MFDYPLLLLQRPEQSLLYAGRYDPLLVVLSVGIAILASYASFVVAQQVAVGRTGARRLLWTLVGGLSMGAGVWAMHFTGMLAFSLPCTTAYDPAITLLSMAPALLACSIAVGMVSRAQVSRAHLVAGGLLIGSGIGAMHYAGMAAYRLNGLIRYDLWLFLLSLLVALVLAPLALWVKFRVQNWQPRWRPFAPLAGAVVMGLAVSAMHYTAMTAAYFIRAGDIQVSEPQLVPTFLASVVLAVTTSLILITLAATFLGRPGAHSFGNVYRSIAFLVAGWGVVAWLGSGYYSAQKMEQAHREGTELARQQVDDAAGSIADALVSLQGIPEALAYEESVLRELRRFGPDAGHSPLAPAERKLKWQQDAGLARLDDFLAKVAVSLRADVIWVVNAAGDCVAASNARTATSFVGTDYADRQYYRQAREGGPGRQYALGRVTRVPGLYYSHPVTDAGRFAGAVVVKRDLPALSRYLRPAGAFIVDANGVIVLGDDRQLEGRTMPGATIGDLSEEARMLQYARTSFEPLGIRPWRADGFADVVVIGGDPRPRALLSQASSGNSITVHVAATLPELSRIQAEKNWIFAVVFTAGGMLIVAIAALVLNVRSTRLARDVAEVAEIRVREQKDFLATILENEPECVKVLGSGGTLLQMNPAGLAMLEVDSVKEANAYGLINFVAPEYRTAFQDLAERVFKGGSGTLEFPILGRRGTRRWLETNAAPLRNAEGKVAYLLSVTRDVTRRKEAEAQLRLAASVFANSYEGILITDADNVITDVNPAFSRITGYAREEAIGRTPRMLSSGRQPPAFYVQMWDSINRLGFWRGEIWNRRKDGSTFVEMLSISVIRDEADRVQHHIAIFTDISEIKQHEAELNRIAHYDTLTGVPNRRLLADRLGQAIARARRSGHPLAVCYLDLDGFKPINDQLGHDVGDSLLIEIANRLQGHLRADDTISRLGGDEFVLLLTDLARPEECHALMERVLGAVSEPVTIGGLSITISASIGASLCPPDEPDADILLRHADQAMYRAKEAGRNRYCLFDPEQDRRVTAHRHKLQRIRQALQQGEFALHYQPKVDVVSGEVVGVEGLIRWQHPDEGLLAPAEFLPFVIGTDLEIPVGEWVIETALRQIEAWRAAGHGWIVSVNISAAQLLQPDFVAHLQLALARHPEVIPGCLELEILETAALSDMERAGRALAGCRALGVRFALDDFGTGYSSLAYFRKLPVDVLKIDQSFVMDMLDDPNDLDIVESVVRLAQAFNRPVIAEGVETLEHGAVLVALGCRLCQGYGIARPMPPEDLPAWAGRWQQQDVWVRVDRSLRREDVFLMVAAQSHRKWIDRLVEDLGDPEGSVVTEVDPAHCRFGRWYKGSGAARYGGLAEFQAIDPIHEQAHALGAELLALARGGQAALARQRVPELYDVRDRLIDLIDRLVAKIDTKQQQAFIQREGRSAYRHG